MEVWVYGPTPELLAAAWRVGRRVVAFGPDPALAAAALAGGPVAAAVAGRAAASADLILFPTSYEGRDVAGRLAARLGRPLIANGVGLAVEGGEDGDRGAVVVETSIFGGSTIVRTAFRGPKPWLASFRPGSFPRDGAPPPSEVVTVGASHLAGAPRIVARHPAPHGGPALDEAAVVVAGGRGMGSGEAFALVAELARLLGGAPAATRAAVDGGWAPYAWQVGQTGKTVAPDVYLAFGLSGAAQHVVGMRGARHVVAVNRDRSAPIFSVADLGVVGDARGVLARLVTSLEARRRS